MFPWPKLCPACGKLSSDRYTPVLWHELGDEWGLTAQQYRQFDRREGQHCRRCGANIRSQQLARLLTSEIDRRCGMSHRSLRGACSDKRASNLEVAEINSAHSLHAFLAALPGLRYSEYGSADVPSENLMALSYADATFDIVTTSDTLEHVPDFDLALREIRRVLSPDGAHIFTIPICWDRPTRSREGLPPSYHAAPGQRNRDDYLVVNEFGHDIIGRIEAAGFAVSVHTDRANPALNVLVARSDAGTFPPHRPLMQDCTG